MRCKGRVISRGWAEGYILYSRDPISFYGGVDPDTGVIIEKGHSLEGVSIAGRILVFPYGKGSTVGTYVIYRLSRRGLAPKAMVLRRAEPIVAVGAILSGIPLIDMVCDELFDSGMNGRRAIVDGFKGYIEVD